MTLRRFAGSLAVAVALGAGSLSAPALFAAGVPDAAQASSSTAPCSRPHSAGEATVPLTVAGTARPFLLYVPKGYSGKKPVPLVLNLHGSGGTGPQQMEVSQMERVADGHDFAIAAPNGAVPLGGGFAW